MSLTDKVIEKVGGALGYLLLKELRRIAYALEMQCNLQLAEQGRQPLFYLSKPATLPSLDDAPISVDAAGERMDPPGGDDGPDWLRLDLLTQLAREQHVEIDLDTDLIALGKERGWLNAGGEVVMLPQEYRNG